MHPRRQPTAQSQLQLHNEEQDNVVHSTNVIRGSRVSPTSLCRQLRRLRYLHYFLGLLLFVWVILHLFHPLVNGILLWHLRIHVDFVLPPYVDPPADSTCFLTTLNEEGKQKYKLNLEHNKKWVESKGWQYYNYLDENRSESMASTGTTGTTNIMFLKYYGIERLFEHEGCEVVVYLDGDAVVIPDQADRPLPLSNEKDVVFGNEVFQYAMLKAGSTNTERGVLNAGFLLFRRTPFSRQFIQDLLRHPRCDGCRDGFCFDFGAGYDQSCIENLLSNEYSDQLHHFGIGKVQAPVAEAKWFAYTPGNLLFCHPAGLFKKVYSDPCKMSTTVSQGGQKL